MKRFTFIAIQPQIQHYFCRASQAYNAKYNKNQRIKKVILVLTSIVIEKTLKRFIFSYSTANSTSFLSCWSGIMQIQYKPTNKNQCYFNKRTHFYHYALQNYKLHQLNDSIDVIYCYPSFNLYYNISTLRNVILVVLLNSPCSNFTSCSCIVGKTTFAEQC